ncbi:MAG TPA: hypothetical protein VGM77_09925 [Gemmatimonadales bacterium]|jgi:hypothetical protein
MKLPVVIGGAFVVGLAGGTVMGMRHAPAPAPAPADSLAVARAPAPAAVLSHDTAAAAAKPDTAAPAAAPPPAATLDTARLAATLAKLAPADAVELTTRLTDDELEAVLRHMGVNSASAVIAAMPKTRAQLMSKRLLGGPK